jgi:transcriptional regulator with XRE-family HTH domain
MRALDEPDPRKLLGGLLRQARAEARLNQDALGHAAGVDRTGVTRMESGQRSLSLTALDAWVERCGVSGLAERGIRAVWELARRHPDDSEPVKIWFVGWVDAEGKAHMVRYWSPLLMPGIVQTADYAHELFGATGRSGERVREGVEARMQRQQILDREDAPTVVIVLWEPVLYHQIGSAAVMRGQLARLLEVAGRPGVLVHVLPSLVGANVGLGGPVSIASVAGKPDVLLTSGMMEDVVTADPHQVRAASATFEVVRGVSANITDTKRIITEAMEAWKTR